MVTPKRYLEYYLLTFLRDKFTSDLDYPYTTDIRTTAISIVQEIPIRLMNNDIPIITIGDVTGRVAQSFIGECAVDATYSICYLDGITVSSLENQTYLIPHTMDAEISVLSIEEDVVDDICDKVATFLRLNRLELMQNGILPMTFDDGDKGEEKIGNDLYKKGSIRLSDILVESNYSLTITGDILTKIIVEPEMEGLDGLTL